MNYIEKYFTDLTADQVSQFETLLRCYPEWNERINVISRKDIANLELHHILHSLAIARFIQPKKGDRILDIGTGGGFPGIPLAVMFPDSEFHLIDSIGKKIRVVENIAREAQVKNIKAEHINVVQLNGRYDYIVSRAVKSLAQMNMWTKDLLKKRGSRIFLKGGDLRAEIQESRMKCEVHDLSSLFEEDFFDTKKVVIC